MAILSRLLLIVLLLLLSACASTGHKLHPVPGLPPAVDVTIQPAYIPPGASASRMSYSTPFERGLVESQVVELQHGPSSQTLIYRRAELHHSLRHGGTDGLYDFLADEVARSTSEQIARLQSISTSR